MSKIKAICSGVYSYHNSVVMNFKSLEVINHLLLEPLSLFQTLMMKMQHILENIDLPDLFVASVEVIMQLSTLYPETLTEYFRVSAAFL